MKCGDNPFYGSKLSVYFVATKRGQTNAIEVVQSGPEQFDF
jgi:hypothetical protein